LRTQFAEVLDEVVGERIVIVENENHIIILNGVEIKRSDQTT
jgi:hypothetical protein